MSEANLETFKKLIDVNMELAERNGEMRAAINIILLNPSLMNDEKIREELSAVANQ